MSRMKDPRKISSVVEDMCHILGLEEALQQFRTLQIWSSVVGDAIAEATTLERFSDGQLFIRVKNPAWRMELNFRRQDIITKLNANLHQQLVREIIFR